VKGCLLFPGAIIGGLVFGLAVTGILHAITDDDDLSTAIGTGAWLLCVMLIMVYGSLWLSDPEDIAGPSESTLTIQRWRNAKAESKLQAAELRMGFVFAMIGGATAAMVNGSHVVIAIVAICSAVLGGLIGFDVRRRVGRIRKQLTADNRRDDG
jgi:hypothetical protein